jgi:hypothetical protein
MMSTDGSIKSHAPGKRMFTTFVVAECILLLGNLLIRVSQREAWLPAWANVAIAIGSAIPLIWFSFQFFRLLRNDLDEMLQRVVLEGFSFALVIFVPLAALYVNARTAGLLSATFDPPELLLVPSILAAIGILISWSRLK